MLFAGKWMHLEITIVNELTQALKDKCDISPHMCILYVNMFSLICGSCMFYISKYKFMYKECDETS